MVAELRVFSAAVILVACNRLPPVEARLVGSCKAQTSPESFTIFTFEPNHTDWCAVTVRGDTWLDGDGRWHIEGKQIVFDDVTIPKSPRNTAAKIPILLKR
jgi:hypothetical protein